MSQLCRKRYTSVLDDPEIPREIQRAQFSRSHADHRAPHPLMMAFDRTQSPRLEADTLDALRAVMQRAMRRGDHGQELQDVLTRTAAEARTKNIHAEQLLVTMKELWFSLPDVRGAGDSHRQTELLQELISRCITQYYAE